MLIILKPGLSLNSPVVLPTLDFLNRLPNLRLDFHQTKTSLCTIQEIHLIGDTQHLVKDNIQALPGVARVIHFIEPYPTIARNDNLGFSFNYNGVNFSEDNLTIFAGLCAVDNQDNVKAVFQALKANQQVCARMGVYKPRTNPYSFQGHGKSCLPYVFELAGDYGIKVIAMEITHERQIQEIQASLEESGNATGVMLQIGTRNAQNFELLKSVGQQSTFPILYKRGYGITLEESLQAVEYIAANGNTQIIFCLRGVKSLLGSPHRNLVDFAHIPIIKRLTRLPVCIDPSHSVGGRDATPDGLNDLFHITAQGIISGANMVLVDFHPSPQDAIVDARQALSLDELKWYLEDIHLVRDVYEKRLSLARNRQSR